MDAIRPARMLGPICVERPVVKRPKSRPEVAAVGGEHRTAACEAQGMLGRECCEGASESAPGA